MEPFYLCWYKTSFENTFLGDSLPVLADQIVIYQPFHQKYLENLENIFLKTIWSFHFMVWLCEPFQANPPINSYHILGTREWIKVGIFWKGVDI